MWIIKFSGNFTCYQLENTYLFELEGWHPQKKSGLLPSLTNARTSSSPFQPSHRPAHALYIRQDYSGCCMGCSGLWLVHKRGAVMVQFVFVDDWWQRGTCAVQLGQEFQSQPRQTPALVLDCIMLGIANGQLR